MLLALVDNQTQPGLPHGCLAVHGCLVGSSSGSVIRDELNARRAATHAALQDRLERAQLEGELPADVVVADFARYVATLIQGLAVQAAAGATRKDLFQVVALAMRAWPDAR